MPDALSSGIFPLYIKNVINTYIICTIIGDCITDKITMTLWKVPSKYYFTLFKAIVKYVSALLKFPHKHFLN